jgi:phosphatidylserine/phosphatidylglycerophosphate/cardiolipin synthase-like enzyme
MIPTARRRVLLVPTALLLLWSQALADEPGRNWQVYFSPHGGAEKAVIDVLKSAKTSVYVQAYSFTNAAIAKALVDAHKRGVVVEVILDRSNRTSHYSAATFLANAGIAASIDAAHEIAHNKVMIIDGSTVVTGSYNFTQQAERGNAENLLVVHDAKLAAKYLANWRKHRAHAE